MFDDAINKEINKRTGVQPIMNFNNLITNSQNIFNFNDEHFNIDLDTNIKNKNKSKKIINTQSEKKISKK